MANRYVWTTRSHRIECGWDNPLGTFYAQVWPWPEPKLEDGEEPTMDAWLGTMPDQYPTVKELADALLRYSAIPMEIEAALERDGALRQPRTALQERICDLLSHAADVTKTGQ